MTHRVALLLYLLGYLIRAILTPSAQLGVPNCYFRHRSSIALPRAIHPSETTNFRSASKGLHLWEKNIWHPCIVWTNAFPQSQHFLSLLGASPMPLTPFEAVGQFCADCLRERMLQWKTAGKRLFLTFEFQKLRPLGKWKRPIERTKHLAAMSWVRTKCLASLTPIVSRIGECQKEKKKLVKSGTRGPDPKGPHAH